MTLFKTDPQTVVEFNSLSNRLFNDVLLFNSEKPQFKVNKVNFEA